MPLGVGQGCATPTIRDATTILNSQSCGSVASGADYIIATNGARRPEAALAYRAISSRISNDEQQVYNADP